MNKCKWNLKIKDGKKYWYSGCTNTEFTNFFPIKRGGYAVSCPCCKKEIETKDSSDIISAYMDNIRPFLERRKKKNIL